MRYTREQVIELVGVVPWHPDSCIRLFWLRHTEGSREKLALQLSAWIGREAIIPLVLRTAGFKDANAVQADALTLFEANRNEIEALTSNQPERLTFLILSKEDFRLVDASSPIELPGWFPLCPLTETHFSVSDLGQSAELKPLNFPQARMDHVAELLFELEQAIVNKLWEAYATDPERIGRFLDALLLNGPKGGEARDSLELFSAHLASVEDPRAYRPNAADKSKFLAARIIKLILGATPKLVANAGEELGRNLHGSGATCLKPTFFAVMWALE